MGRWVRGTFKAVLVGGGLFTCWLFAVWPPPVWYRTHWPAETAFQAMRRRGAGAQGRSDAADSSERRALRRDWCASDLRPCVPALLRLYHPVPFDSISHWMEKTVTTGEDQRFRDHHGIDWVNLRHALGYPRDGFTWGSPRDRRDLTRALSHAWARRGALRGASTITQQLAKNLYLSPSRNPLRKVKEAVTAYRMEAALGKDRILELYLNVVEMGPEVWGTDAAAWYYFHHGARELSLDEAATLAGLLPFPLSSNPDQHPGRMASRQRLILLKIRGVPVIVPMVPEEDVVPPPPESLPPPILDTARPILDSILPPAVESLGPPHDTLPAPPDSGAKPR